MTIALTPAERAQLTDLSARYKESRGTDHELDQVSENLYWSLFRLREIELLCTTPTPACCEGARTHPAILYDIASSVNAPGEDPGRWYLATHSKHTQARASFRSGGWIECRWAEVEPPSPKFCPYCGAALPAMRLKDPLPRNICNSGGEDWCETCDSRLRDCLCDLPWSAFEPEPG